MVRTFLVAQTHVVDCIFLLPTAIGLKSVTSVTSCTVLVAELFSTNDRPIQSIEEISHENRLPHRR